MALRILFIILGFILVVNLVLITVGVVMNVNLYKSYGRQILKFFAVFAILIILAYVVLGLLGLS